MDYPVAYRAASRAYAAAASIQGRGAARAIIGAVRTLMKSPFGKFNPLVAGFVLGFEATWTLLDMLDTERAGPLPEGFGTVAVTQPAQAGGHIDFAADGWSLLSNCGHDGDLRKTTTGICNQKVSYASTTASDVVFFSPHTYRAYLFYDEAPAVGNPSLLTAYHGNVWSKTDSAYTSTNKPDVLAPPIPAVKLPRKSELTDAIDDPWAVDDVAYPPIPYPRPGVRRPYVARQYRVAQATFPGAIPPQSAAEAPCKTLNGVGARIVDSISGLVGEGASGVALSSPTRVVVGTSSVVFPVPPGVGTKENKPNAPKRLVGKPTKGRSPIQVLPGLEVSNLPRPGKPLTSPRISVNGCLLWRAAVRGVTEINDLSNALWAALPPQFKAYDRGPNGELQDPKIFDKWTDIYNSWSKLGESYFREALVQILANQMVDFTYGFAGIKSAQAVQNFADYWMRASGLQTGDRFRPWVSSNVSKRSSVPSMTMSELPMVDAFGNPLKVGQPIPAGARGELLVVDPTGMAVRDYRGDPVFVAIARALVNEFWGTAQ